jgi:hypothetical protein
MRQGRWEEAQGAVQEGLVLTRRLGYPYGEGRILQVAGELQSGIGRPAAARERLAEALAIFRRLGAGLEAERTERLLVIVG